MSAGPPRTELSPAEISLRVGGFAAVLGLLGLGPPGLHLFVGGLFTLATLAFFSESWSRRRSRMALKMNLLWGLFSAVGAMLLVSGLVRAAAMPLLGFAGVCLALAVIARLSQGDSEPEA